MYACVCAGNTSKKKNLKADVVSVYTMQQLAT